MTARTLVYGTSVAALGWMAGDSGDVRLVLITVAVVSAGALLFECRHRLGLSL